eukprot:Blabericola_migrator_1__5867@NODE_296_length_10232_cov_145_755239_g243_i0_p2_GENE_NODE_296_length_10232_cov_145_755239_g243_i0NODE_296_length_10232_cov_145_755239_g243_i0_p2_ORF_typecomplete_len597_score72_58DNA_pol_A_exo1/PF01612_20/8_1e07_NODE_296_length_10232_cov_145_755239_g243_i04882278
MQVKTLCEAVGRPEAAVSVLAGEEEVEAWLRANVYEANRIPPDPSVVDEFWKRAEAASGRLSRVKAKCCICFHVQVVEILPVRPAGNGVAGVVKEEEMPVYKNHLRNTPSSDEDEQDAWSPHSPHNSSHKTASQHTEEVDYISDVSLRPDKASRGSPSTSSSSSRSLSDRRGRRTMRQSSYSSSGKSSNDRSQKRGRRVDRWQKDGPTKAASKRAARIIPEESWDSPLRPIIHAPNSTYVQRKRVVPRVSIGLDSEWTTTNMLRSFLPHQSKAVPTTLLQLALLDKILLVRLVRRVAEPQPPAPTRLYTASPKGFFEKRADPVSTYPYAFLDWRRMPLLRDLLTNSRIHRVSEAIANDILNLESVSGIPLGYIEDLRDTCADGCHAYIAEHFNISIPRHLKQSIRMKDWTKPSNEMLEYAACDALIPLLAHFHIKHQRSPYGWPALSLMDQRKLEPHCWETQMAGDATEPMLDISVEECSQKVDEVIKSNEAKFEQATKPRFTVQPIRETGAEVVKILSSSATSHTPCDYVARMYQVSEPKFEDVGTPKSTSASVATVLTNATTAKVPAGSTVVSIAKAKKRREAPIISRRLVIDS